MAELSWDAEISNDEVASKLLTPGKCSYRILKFERKRFAGSAKISPCPQVDLEVELTDVNRVTTTSKSMLLLHTDMEWKLSQFFRSIGLKKHGQPLRMDWNKVPGATGFCIVATRKYTNKEGEEKEGNEIKEWLDHETTTTAKPRIDAETAGWAASDEAPKGEWS